MPPVKKAAVIVTLTAAAFFAGAILNKSRTSANAINVDGEYVEALGCLNSFFGLWVLRDGKHATAFLSKDLRKSKSQEEWEALICGISNPHHAAYEIAGCKRIGPHEYRFYVWTYESYTGQESGPVSRGEPKAVQVAKEGDYFRISALPQL